MAETGSAGRLMALEPGTRLGIYEIAGPIGAGGMGEVYRATDTKLGRDVAIKTLPATLADDADRLARFEREAKLLAALNHAHIASVYSLDEHDGTLYIAMELVEGETLESKLKAGALPVDEALQIALQIAEALEAAHDKGVVHRDLKPANIMVSTAGVVKVLDFGLAKAFSDDPDETSPAQSPALSVAMTQQGLVLGTAAYMSPEQASGQATDQRADVWAFGVVVYEMLTGLPLYSGESVPHILAAVLQIEPDWNRLPKDLHPRLRQMLERCLEKKPRNRYAGISDARVDIQQALNAPAGLAVGTRDVAAMPSMLPRMAAAIVLTALVVGAAAWSIWPADVPRSVNRFDYDLPEGQSFRFPNNRLLAISPDGRHFAYVANERFYLRTLDQLDARLISGTADDFGSPAFSPDGQSVAYFHFYSSQLNRIAVAGGAPVPIAEGLVNPTGVSWAEDDSIWFGQPEGIMRVSANGGEPELIVASEGQERVFGPQLLPDGDSVLFASTMSDWNAGQILVYSISTGERKVVQGGAGDARYVPSGHLVYASGDGLFGIRFDLGSLSTVGNSVSLEQNVMRGSTSGVAHYAVSDDGTLIFATGGLAADERSLVWVDRNGREESISLQASQYVYPRISPAGDRVALDDRNENNDIRVFDLAGGTLERLIIGETGGQYPVWTPDGDRIAFSPPESRTIAWKAANNTGSVEIIREGGATAGGGASPYVFSPSGDELELVFRDVANPGTQDDIAMLTIGSDADPVRLLRGQQNERNAELSPNGQWMAYQSDESGQYEIYVRPFPNVDDDRVPVSNAGGIMPLWSRDQSELFYLESGDSPRLISAVVDVTETSLTVVSRTVVFDDWPYLGTNAPGGRTYDVSPDGSRFLAVTEAASLGTTPQIVIVQNWFSELERLLPTD